jgi:hypothetical protein
MSEPLVLTPCGPDEGPHEPVMVGFVSRAGDDRPPRVWIEVGQGSRAWLVSNGKRYRIRREGD